ncbi:hypothetical protein RvY_04603 [Ramazzottius varieornatus]|uniref:Uncharacterized protein n=1 Tax=Ramazzottius varieornatus TaxID=947166 RepID=A0A1D1US69_RAMVA|nr:hypothetical protein RvY_04603 [Ramazzottius varieornatus]
MSKEKKPGRKQGVNSEGNRGGKGWSLILPNPGACIIPLDVPSSSFGEILRDELLILRSNLVRNAGAGPSGGYGTRKYGFTESLGVFTAGKEDIDQDAVD